MSKTQTQGLEKTAITINGHVRTVKSMCEEAMTLLGHNTDASDAAAFRTFQAITEQAPTFALGYFQRARLELKLGKREAAVEHAAKAKALDPTLVYFRVFLIALYSDAGKLDQATSEMDALIKEQPEHFPFAADLPQSPPLARLQGFLDQTLTRVITPFIFYDGNLVAREAHIYSFLSDLNDPEKTQMAVEHAQRFLKGSANTNYHELRFYLVKYLKNQGRLDEALDIARMAGEKADWPCRVLLGSLLAVNGEVEEAFASFKQAALSNERLPLVKLDGIDKQEREQVLAWFAALVESLPGYAGAYHDGWVYPPLPGKGVAGSKENDGATLAQALADIRETIANPRGWVALARNDIATRYRRTVLGPWWIVFGTGLALTGMAFVWSMLFGMTMSEFFPYISSGYVTWMFISAIMMEGCGTFSGQATSIMQTMPMSKTVHVARLVLRNFLIFLHTMAIFVVVALVYQVDVNANTLLVIPGVLLMLLVAPAVALLFGIIGLRYRDFGPALGAVMTVLFLLTPVLWKAEQLGTRGYYAFFNPMTHFISIIREPLLGHAPLLLSYAVVVGIAIVLWVLALWGFSNARNRLVFWL